MGVGLQPLEFTECLADSPQFRDNLQRHEKELEKTSQQIKRLIKEVKDVVSAAKRLSAAQLALASTMEQLEFVCVGASLTEDERVITRSLRHFAQLMRTIEDERERMLGRAHAQIIEPLERFRKEHIGAVKEGKKKFDKKTAKFCQTQERTLALSTKKPDAVFQEADAALEMASRDFCAASLEYVLRLQATHERKKFELVEALLGFVFSWWTFHHTAHDVHADAEPHARDLTLRIQRTRANFEETSKQTESLMKKMMEMRLVSKEDEAEDSGVRAGYLFLMEKKAFGSAWSKQWAVWERGRGTLALTPYNQINPKSCGATDTVCVCGARPCADTDRRFCWEAIPEPGGGGGDGGEAAAAAGGGGGDGGGGITLQALCERDRASWLRALTHNQHTHHKQNGVGAGCGGGVALDAAGFAFVSALVAELEARGLDEQGLYRVGGVSSKVSRLLSQIGKLPPLGDALLWDSRTLTSALKAYLRALPQPLTTSAMHHPLIHAMQLESVVERVSAVRSIVQSLPAANRDMLHLVISHLRRVVANSGRNLMSAANVSVCFGPTLMRAQRESVAAILEIKFYNALVETLITHAEHIFNNDSSSPAPPPPQPPTTNGSRTDISSGPRCGVPLARYSHHQHQLLQHFAPPSPAAPAPAPAPASPHTRPGRRRRRLPAAAAAAAPPPAAARPARTQRCWSQQQ